MKIEITDIVWFGDQEICTDDQSGRVAVVHACKHPCHANAVGYEGSLPKDHPEYLFKKDRFHLYLNMVDSDRPLFKLASFREALDFIDFHYSQRNVIVHCNMGMSRSAAIVMLFMAKRMRIIPNDSFEAALEKFRSMAVTTEGPVFDFSPGILTFLRRHWEKIV